MTTERDLIQQLAETLAEEYGVQREFDSGEPLLGSGAIELLSRTRAFLSQPEPEGPTDEELLAIAIESELVASNGTNPFREDSDIEDEVMQFARAVLARWGRPAVEPETNGQA